MIVALNHDNIKDVNKVNEPFEIIGRILPKYENHTWTYTEEMFSETREKRYPEDDEDFETYIGNEDKAIYFYYDNDVCIGQLKIHKSWGKYVFIDEIFVSRNARGKGVGQALIQKAIEWAKQYGYMGLKLETQDNNIMSNRFYSKCGFQIGGMDDMVYGNIPHIANEKAIYWYMKW